MIEILHPDVDADRIAMLPYDGYRLVDGWLTALPELAELDRYLDSGAVWDTAAVAAASRYVVYPWRRIVVKLPAAEEFLRLRTARNRWLIEADEQAAWASALIGIAGLSVGASALTVCSLTGARRFRLADPDTLGPTNLNRLVGSVCDLGEPKLTLAMRRTLETDPYTEIEPFPDGYSPAVADAFLGNGTTRLTVLLEEMDDLAMKVDIRARARAAGVPVVMVTDNGDNALVDVERYDLDPDYPLFHGRAGDLSGVTAADLVDPRRRAEIAGAVVGDDITPRTRASLAQVGRTLPSWPQLGTAATLAGSVAALAARLIATGAPLPSGRYRLDADTALLGLRSAG